MIMEAKIAAGSIMAGVTGIVATGNASNLDLGWLRPLVELGSFGIIAFAAIFVMIRVAPEFIRHLDKARDAFMVELREERIIRQKHFDAVSTDLHSIDKSIQQLERTIKER
jgi:hypothetical protein